MKASEIVKRSTRKAAKPKKDAPKFQEDLGITSELLAIENLAEHFATSTFSHETLGVAIELMTKPVHLAISKVMGERGPFDGGEPEAIMGKALRSVEAIQDLANHAMLDPGCCGIGMMKNTYADTFAMLARDIIHHIDKAVEVAKGGAQ